MNRADLAEKLFREGYNCSQSVFGAFTDVTGMDLATSMRYASGFGAGFGKMREVCGAVSGMTMLASILKGYSDPGDREGKIATYCLVQEMIKEFEEEMGSRICRELLHIKPGEDPVEPSVRTEEYYNSRPCIHAVRTGASLVEKYLLVDN